MDVKVMGARFGCGWSEPEGAAVAASCPMQRGGGFLPDAARRWLLARCGAAVASCPIRRGRPYAGGGFLPVASWSSVTVVAALNVLRTDSEGWGCQSFGNVEQDVENRGRMSR